MLGFIWSLIFLLTWPAVMQIYFNKKVYIISLEKDLNWLGTRFMTGFMTGLIAVNRQPSNCPPFLTVMQIDISRKTVFKYLRSHYFS